MNKDTYAVTQKDLKRQAGKKSRKTLSELTLLDRFLFDIAMEDKNFCRTVLSIILGKEDIPPIRYGIAEKNMEQYYDSRAVRLDLVAFDENDAVYDAEAQKKNTGLVNLSKRSRYYQAQIDINLLEPGEEEFENLNDTYVIFISPFDLFGLGKYRYTFRMRCDEDTDLVLPDGQVHIYLNTHGTNTDEVPSELTELLDFMENTQKKNRYRSQRVEKLSRQVADIKANQEVGIKYMRFKDEFLIERMEARAEGRAEGRTEGSDIRLITQVCKKLVKNKSVDEIADAIEEDVSFVQEICDIAGEFAPDYDIEKIYASYREKHGISDGENECDEDEV